MRYNKLGNTGLFVSEFCLGTMTFGTPAPQYAAAGGVQQETMDQIFARAFDAGINFTKATLTMGWCIECHDQATIAPGVLADDNSETLTYYDEIHNRLVKHNKTLYSKFLDDDKVSPRELGGWECAKCHY